jgi:hypothetical protein
MRKKHVALPFALSTSERTESWQPREALPKPSNHLESRELLKILQAGQKDSEARRAMIDERRRTDLVR